MLEEFFCVYCGLHLVDDVQRGVRLASSSLVEDDLVASENVLSLSLDQSAVLQDSVDSRVGRANCAFLRFQRNSSAVIADHNSLNIGGQNFAVSQSINRRVGHAILVNLSLEGPHANCIVDIRSVLDVDNNGLAIDVNSDQIVAVRPVECLPASNEASDGIASVGNFAEVDNSCEGGAASFVGVVNELSRQSRQLGVASEGLPSAVSALADELRGFGDVNDSALATIFVASDISSLRLVSEDRALPSSIQTAPA